MVSNSCRNPQMFAPDLDPKLCLERRDLQTFTKAADCCSSTFGLVSSCSSFAASPLWLALWTCSEVCCHCIGSDDDNFQNASLDDQFDVYELHRCFNLRLTPHWLAIRTQAASIVPMPGSAMLWVFIAQYTSNGSTVHKHVEAGGLIRSCQIKDRHWDKPRHCVAIAPSLVLITWCGL